MIGKNGWQLRGIIEEAHISQFVLSGNLLAAAQHLGNRLSRILGHIPCETLCLILKSGH
jgi:hypothetical protein